MHYLVSGAAGFIGAHFVTHVLSTEPDAHVTAIVTFRHSGVPERLTQCEKIQAAWDRLRIVHHDLRADLSAVALAQMVDAFGPVDHVVHFAAESHVDRSLTDPRPFIENNVAATLSMLEAARVLKPRSFVQISTDEVYGAAQGDYRHQEWDPIIPSNPYAASKAAQEAIAISYWRAYGVPVVITNTMNNYGERQHPEKYIPMVMRRVLRGECVPIHAVNGVVGSRFYLHARNHADAVLHLLQRYDSDHMTPRGVFMYPLHDRPLRANVVGEREVTNLELAEMIAGFIGRPLIYDLVDAHSSRPGHDLRYALSGFKTAQLGWTPPVSLEESLGRTVAWTLAHPEWLAL